jgi:hypothetical protein
MQVKQPPHTKSTAQGPQPARAIVAVEAREHPAPGGVRNLRVRHVLVWTVLTLLAALALVVATLVVAPADPAPPPPTSPMQFGPSMGHARPY